MSGRSIKRRLLLPLGFAFPSIIVVAVSCIYWLQLTYIDRAVTNRLAGVENLIPKVFGREAEVLRAQLDFLAADKELQLAWQERDRERLQQLTLPLLQHLKAGFGVTHLYLVQPDRSCFLRAHKPDAHGDILDRFTMMEAVRTGKTASGIELGRFEAFTLRVVHPWYIAGELSGYLELGKEIVHLTDSLRKVLGVDLVFTLSKSLLVRDEWEKGKEIFNISGNWDDFPAFVVVDQTFGRMEPSLVGILQNLAMDDTQRLSFETVNGREYRGRIAPLHDAGDRRVGQMLVFYEFTAEAGYLRKALILVTGFSVIAAGFLIIFFNFYAGRLDRTLNRSFEDLEREVRERRKTQLELQNYQDQLHDLVAARTAELEEANRLLEQDIRRRQQIEEALRESEQKFRSLFDCANEIILIIDPETLNLLEVNRTASQRLGYGINELKNHCLTRLYAPAQAELARADVLKTLEKGHLVAERAQISREGLEIPVEVSSQAIEYEGRRVVLAFAREITDRKKAEAEQRKAQKLESIGILAGGIAHDFNNILTAIQGNITLAMMSMEAESRSHSKLSMAEKAISRARGLAQQLLTFSKGGAPVIKICDVPRLVEEQVAMTLRGSSVKCEFQFPEGLWLIKVDEGQFSQVMSNLALNAIQAMPGGGILRVSAVNEILGPENTLGLAAGRYVRIDFTDQGCGITKANLDKIFDPYFTTKKTGSGLGLAISFSIIKKHEGIITVRSVPNQGTSFTLYLPASRRKKVVPREESVSVLPGAGRILMMDDDEDINEAAADLLRSLGYQVETVISGAEAVSAFKRARSSGEPFDVVIADLTVPGGMGGEETAQQLLALDPETKVIVSSGYANNSIMADCSRYGFKGVLPKPYKIDELSKILRQVIGDKGPSF